MNIEEARKFANERFTQLIQPVIDEPEEGAEELNAEEFNRRVEELKAEVAKKTGFEVEQFYVQPLGLGLYEVTTVFKHGERRRRTGDALLYN